MFDLTTILTESLATLMNSAVMVAGFVLSIAGYILNFSIGLTLKISAFVASTPAIFTTWRAIRDISGICIIFLLLYAAIQLILNLKSNSFGSLIKNVVIIGLLINFSFFFTSLGIDASNIVSIQLYNAIAPANSLNVSASSGGNTAGGISFRAIDGGISDIFMNSLKIQSVSQTALAANAQGESDGESDGLASQIIIILMSGVVAVGIELAAAASFLAASAAFIFRFVVLLLLLAFSPIWILGIGGIIPKIQEYSSKWSKQYFAMLQFMPVYLLLLYVAMSVLTSNPAGLFGGVNGAIAVGNGAWYSSLLVFGVNAFIVIFLLNMPLVAAISLGGSAEGVMKAMNKTSKWLGGWVGTRTAGRLAGAIDKSVGNTRVGNSLIGRGIRGTTVGALAKNKMGYTYSNEERLKVQKEIKAKNREIVRGSRINKLLNSNSDATKEYKEHISLMSEKEKLDLGKNALINPQVLKHFKKSDFEAIKKSEDIKDDERKTILKVARIKALTDAAEKSAAGNKDESDAVKHMLKEMEPSDISGLDESLLENAGLIEHLTSGQLKALMETDLSIETRKKIAKTILEWRSRPGSSPESKGKQHISFGWMKKNNREWDGEKGIDDKDKDGEETTG